MHMIYRLCRLQALRVRGRLESEGESGKEEDERRINGSRSAIGGGGSRPGLRGRQDTIIIYTLLSYRRSLCFLMMTRNCFVQSIAYLWWLMSTGSSISPLIVLHVQDLEARP
ncbi:hypothetical protein KCU64_g54, partial [Aureobasidium melanogenum]